MTEEQLRYRLKNLRNEEVMIQKGISVILRERSSQEFSPERILDELIAAETLHAMNYKQDVISEQKTNRQHEIELSKLNRARKECKSIFDNYNELLSKTIEIQKLKKAILELEQPAQLVIFERYLEGKTVKQSLKSICVSKATYWRVHKRGLLLLLSIIENDLIFKA